MWSSFPFNSLPFSSYQGGRSSSKPTVLDAPLHIKMWLGSTIGTVDLASILHIKQDFHEAVGKYTYHPDLVEIKLNSLDVHNVFITPLDGVLDIHMSGLNASSALTNTIDVPLEIVMEMNEAYSDIHIILEKALKASLIVRERKYIYIDEV